MKQLNVDCIVFDLDDTLYPQIEYDLGCLKKSAEYISKLCGKSGDEIFGYIKEIVTKNGIEYRKIFDDLFEEIKFDGMCYIKDILKCYWSARPHISVYPDTNHILRYLKDKYSLAMITDGYVDIQTYKIGELRLSDYFNKIYFTDSYGVENRKPSKYVFDVFIKETKLSPNRCVYIGNDPRKDFIPARDVGMHSIRIRQGSFADITPDTDCEADYIVDSISQLTDLI